MVSSLVKNIVMVRHGGMAKSIATACSPGKGPLAASPFAIPARTFFSAGKGKEKGGKGGKGDRYKGEGGGKSGFGKGKGGGGKGKY